MLGDPPLMNMYTNHCCEQNTSGFHINRISSVHPACLHICNTKVYLENTKLSTIFGNTSCFSIFRHAVPYGTAHSPTSLTFSRPQQLNCLIPMTCACVSLHGSSPVTSLIIIGSPCVICLFVLFPYAAFQVHSYLGQAMSNTAAAL